MHVISPKKLKEFWLKHPDAEIPLRTWLRITEKARWESLADTRKDFPHADLVGVCTVFNIKGNDYRLITKIYYQQQTVLVRAVLTHREYDKGKWKDDCSC
jgi:mRNA interferase HigB